MEPEINTEFMEEPKANRSIVEKVIRDAADRGNEIAGSLVSLESQASVFYLPHDDEELDIRPY